MISAETRVNAWSGDATYLPFGYWPTSIEFWI